jgi:hypothetical protein
MIFSKKTRKIDFLVCGTQKGGTTALDHYLRKHPEIGMGKKKELHFFDNEVIFSKSPTNYSAYENMFNFNGDEKTFGEITPIYMYWEPSCKRIWEYNSDIKLIFILRSPTARAFSHWNMVEVLIKNLSLMLSEMKQKEFLPLQHRVYSYVDRGYYSEQIKRYKSYFNESKLMFIKYECFRDNQEAVLKEVFNFLEVNSNNYVFEYQTIHKRDKHAKMRIEDKNFLLDKFKHEIHEVEEILNWDCSDWLV